jgi:ribosome-associated translation inhibitor RaiA
MEHPIEFVIRAGQPDTTEALREYAARRLSFALRRFEPRIRHVTVRILDLNGPKRGVDSRCSMTVDLVDGRHIFVNATTAWPFASVKRAAGRLNKTLGRELKRETSRRPRNLRTLSVIEACEDVARAPSPAARRPG